jgi:hypothetical protein
MDRLLKSNTARTRTHSLFRQGCMLYELIPNMPQHRLLPLMQRFPEMLLSSGLFWQVSVGDEMTGRVKSASAPRACNVRVGGSATGRTLSSLTPFPVQRMGSTLLMMG